MEDTKIAKYLIISFPSFVKICEIYLKKNRKANLPIQCSSNDQVISHGSPSVWEAEFSRSPRTPS